MKTALYITDRRLQVVLTPENEHEQRMLAFVEQRELVQMYRGSFYECNGGWTRWQRDYPYEDAKDRSLILVLDGRAEA